MIARNMTRGHLLASRVRAADSFGLRLRGLMFRRELPEGEGLLIKPCRSVHTHFMRFPIDVLFLDQLGRVIHLIPAMKPWQISPTIWEAAAVLELPAGAAGPTVAGDELSLDEVG